MAAPVFPLALGGAAEDATDFLGGRDRFAIADLTARDRWGLKGPGSADWLSGRGIALPAINRHADVSGMTVLRLGQNDLTFLTHPADRNPLEQLRSGWQAAASPKGYPGWREESWAWLELSGGGLDAVLARLTAIDLRPGRFGADEIAQTRVAHVDAVFFRRDDTLQLFFDITATAAVVRRIAHAARPEGEYR